MHFTKLEQYALLLMGELARSDAAVPLSLVSVSRRHGVSVPFLKKIVRSLRASRLVRSKEGIGGGYILTRTPATISLWAILSSFREMPAKPMARCPLNDACLPQHIRSIISQTIQDRLEHISLAEAI